MTDLYLHNDFWRSSARSNDGCPSKQITGKCRGLSEILLETRPTVVICDIEGGEEGPFENVNLSSIRALVVEVHPDIIGREGARSLVQVLLAAGFFLDNVLSLNNVLCFAR